MNTLSCSIIELPQRESLLIREEELEFQTLAPNQVVGITRYSAVSPGTEVAAYRGDAPLRPGKIYPRVVGYCNVAEVLAVGAAVTHCRVGDLIYTHQSHRSGFVCLEQDVLCVLPSGLDATRASTAYLFHLGYSALLKAQYQPGMTVSIIGLGTLGIAAALLCKALGIPVVTLSGQSLQDAEMPASIAKSADAFKAFAQANPLFIGGTDVVINTSNAWEDHRLSMEIAGFGGKVCVLGFPGRTGPLPDFNPLDSSLFYDKQLTLAACGWVADPASPSFEQRFTLKRNLAYLMGLMAEETLNPEPLISEVAPWRGLESVYKRMMSREACLRTVVLDWSGGGNV